MTQQEKWAAVFAALDRAVKELEGRWPVPYHRPVTRVRGYSRERGRRPVVEDAP